VFDSDRMGTREHARFTHDIRKLCESMSIGVCTFDLDLKFDFINAWLAELNGLSVDEHLGRSLSEILPGRARGGGATWQGD
jgi:PAS domain-containing protein